jgi:hypothetical protein
MGSRYDAGDKPVNDEEALEEPEVGLEPTA